MITTPWLKVLLDLWEHRVRTVTVALAIAVGVYAVGVVLDAREILVREYRGDQATAAVASAIIHTAPFQQDFADGVAHLPMVRAAEGRSTATGRVYRSTGKAAGQTQTIVLIAVPNFSDMQVDAIRPFEGAYPPGRREVVLERLSFDSLGAAIGREITIQLDNDATRTLKVVGSVHDPGQFSPSMSGEAVGYVTPETMQSLGYSDRLTELHILVTPPAHDEAHILAAVSQVEARLKDSGRTILSRRIITQAPADPFIGSVVLILTAFGLVILLLSGFLVVNAMSALITQQIPQIGVMKLIGARRGQIMVLYLATVLIYGLLAVAFSLPLAALTARLLMTEMVEKLLNVMPASYAIPLPLLVAQAAVGLVLPLAAGLAPVIRGTGVTTNQALNDAGLAGNTYRRGLVERLLAGVSRIVAVQRPLLLAVRNTLRHKGRLAQTLIVLIVGTGLFVSVLSVRASVDATLASFMRFHQYDVSVQMESPEMIARLDQAAAEVPGVAGVEVWSLGSATRVRSDDSKSNAFRVTAVPPGTRLMSPEMIAGSWLSSAQGKNALVVNSDFVDDEKDVHVGGDVTLDIGGRKATWHVIGIVSTESKGPALYANLDDYAYATRTPGQGTHVQVVGVRHDEASQRRLASALQEHLDAIGYKVSSTQTGAVVQQQNQLLFTVVVAFLILMALLLAAVGGLGLTTTMGINMMERVREVGVLRAIGASNGSVRRIVLTEGVAIAVISWVAGTLLSLALAPLFSRELGVALIKIPLHYHYSVAAAAGWFFVLLAIAVAASLGPARNAVRLTVREVLAYE